MTDLSNPNKLILKHMSKVERWALLGAQNSGQKLQEFCSKRWTDRYNDRSPLLKYGIYRLKPNRKEVDTEKHTPGPWRVIIDDDGGPLSGRPGVFASEELDCGIVHWDGFIQEYWRSARGDKEIHANAHLIAAAPDMYEALEMMVNFFDDVAPDCMISKARSALAKAEGKT